MSYSESLLRRFVKDYNLPINVYREDVFNYMIELLDPVYLTKDKFARFEHAIQYFGGESEFFVYFNGLKDRIIAEVLSKPAYQRFISADMNAYGRYGSFSGRSIYNDSLVGCDMISIDLKKANFNSLRYYDPSIVGGAETYDAFMDLYDVHDYFRESKQLRQVIFGNLNPKRQQTIQTHIIDTIALCVQSSLGLDKDNIVVASSDEIVLLNVSDKNAVLKAIPSQFVDMVSVERFCITKIHPIESWYIKIGDKEGAQFKQVPSLFLPQVLKRYYELDLTEFDMLFMHEGRCAKFIEPVYPS